MSVTDERPEELETPDDAEASDPTVSDPEPVSALRSGKHLDRLAELEEERRYLLASLKDLESERAAGDVDDDDYATLKDGYTVRAASVLREIESGRRALAPKPPRNWKRTIVVGLAVIAFSVAVAAALASAFGERGLTDEITGLNPRDDTRTTLASARASLNGGDFVRAQQLFIDAAEEERARGEENAEAVTYVGWTTALLARQAAAETGVVDQELLRLGQLALNQAISIDPTFADPYCFVAIIEYNFNDDAVAALPFVDECESLDPPADIAGLIESFADEIRTAAAAAAS